jgi:hypothetical protein
LVGDGAVSALCIYLNECKSRPLHKMYRKVEL